MTWRPGGVTAVGAWAALITGLASSCIDLADTAEPSAGGAAGKGGSGGSSLDGSAGWPDSGGGTSAGGTSAGGTSAGGTSAGGTSTGGTSTGGTSAGGTSAGGGPPCDLSKPFGAPAPIAELNTPAGEASATLTHDELTIYYQVGPAGDAGVTIPGWAGETEIATASRSSKTSAFGGAKILTSLATANYETNPSATGDDLTLFFSSDQTGTKGGFDLWFATRSSPASSFSSNVTNIGALNTAEWDFNPYVMPDGLTLYFSFSPTGGGQPDLRRATRTLSTPFVLDTSGVLDSVNTGATEFAPAVSPDELTLYFVSNRPGGSVWKATRGSASQPFGVGVSVSELNPAGGAIPNWLSDDQCRLYLCIAGDLYVATKP